MSKTNIVYSESLLKEIVTKEARKVVEKRVATDIRKKIATEGKAVKGPYSRRQKKGSGGGQSTGLGSVQNISIQSAFDERSFYKTGISSIFITDETPPQPSVFFTDPNKVEKYEARWLPREKLIYPVWVNNGEWMDLKTFLRSGRKVKTKRNARPYFDKAYKSASKALPTYADWVGDALCSNLGVRRIK